MISLQKLKQPLGCDSCNIKKADCIIAILNDSIERVFITLCKECRYDLEREIIALEKAGKNE